MTIIVTWEHYTKRFTHWCDACDAMNERARNGYIALQIYCEVPANWWEE